MKSSLLALRIVSDDERVLLNRFLELYTKCELVFKRLYPAFRKAKNGVVIDVKKLNINVQLIEASLRWCGIQYEDTDVKKIFSADKVYRQPGNRSCTLLWNEILHKHNDECIQEVLDRYRELTALME